jgi:hypothetical protein
MDTTRYDVVVAGAGPCVDNAVLARATLPTPIEEAA